jgi:hypothetical protein
VLPEYIAWAVAEGIALGRKEGIALAAEAIADLQGTSDALTGVNALAILPNSPS